MSKLLNRLRGKGASAEESRKAALLAAQAAEAAEGEDGEDEDEEAKAAEGDEDGEDEDAKAAEGDEDDDDEEDEEPMAEENAKAQAARRRERGRIAAIVRAPAAAGRGPLALALAFNTDMTSTEALAVLADTPKAAKGGLAAEMKAAAVPHLGPGPAGRAAKTMIDTQSIYANRRKATTAG